MLVTVSAELPLLVIVIVTVVVVPVTTLPKARFPLTPMTREGTGMPVAEQLIVLPPLVASLLTVTVPPLCLHQSRRKCHHDICPPS